MARTPTPAQLAARERFAEMARSGAFKKKAAAARNPAKKTVSQKISQLSREGYPQKQAVAIALEQQRAGKVKQNPIEKHLGGTTYGIIREEVFGYGDKRYRAMVVQKSKTGVPGEVATDLLDAKSFKTKAGAERFLESYGRKNNPRKPTYRRTPYVAPDPDLAFTRAYDLLNNLDFEDVYYRERRISAAKGVRLNAALDRILDAMERLAKNMKP